METITVNLGTRSYPIYLAPDGLNETGPLLAARPVSKKALVVTNSLINHLYGEPVAQSLRNAGFIPEIVETPDGEANKSLNMAMELYTRAIRRGLDRRSVVVALGGGVVGDLAGFVAATYMRGIPFVQVPTTLLAQVDSSVGGKVAVNHPLGKNMIGAFHQPLFVLIDPVTLATLPVREWQSGLAEVVKYGVILDGDLFQYLENHAEAVRKRDPAVLIPIIATSCRCKAGVVERDEQESHLRQILNFGHTIGHALESLTGYNAYRHGEAVAIGMVAAGRIAVRMNLLAPEIISRLEGLLTGLGLPTRFGQLSPAAIVTQLQHDKKSNDGRLNWVLPRALGDVIITADVPSTVIMDVLEELGRSPT